MTASTQSKMFLNVLILSMILTGAGNTIVYKLQNITMVTYEGLRIKFNHPFMQAIAMFIGEGLCFLLFVNYRRQPEYKNELLDAQIKGLKVKVNYFWLMVPAVSDLSSSTLQYIALNYIQPSIYQMLRGGVIVVTALFSVFFLKRRITRTQLFGCCLVIVGITIVGMSNIIFKNAASESDSTTAEQVVAMVLILLSLLFNGVQFVSEEKLFSIYHMHPYQVVGAEGCWGLFVYLLILPILTFVQCPDALQDNCVQHQHHYHFERPDAYLYEITHDPLLFFLVILGIITIAIFNICGVSVTKYISSLARSIVDVSRTVLVWLVGLIISFADPESPWENTDYRAILLELFGFVLLVLGNLIYNQILLGDGRKTEESSSDPLMSLEEKQD